jgi:DNA-binding response OmpR family regulator
MPTALIVEDEPEANKLLAALVRLRGYRTDSAYDGSSALEKVKAGIPDVIFLDLMLPDRSGHDVCRALKASGSTLLLPVVIVTARLAAENRIESFSAGADDYVPKPYTPDQIFDAIDHANAWKDDIAAPLVDGEVLLDGRDDGKTLRRLAQLRSLLLARGRLETRSVEMLATAIKAIWASVDAWSRRNRVDQVATLSYELTPELLTVTVFDEAGWLSGTGELPERASLQCLSEAGFEHVQADDGTRRLKLVKRLGAV